MHADPVQSSRSKLSSEVFRTLRCTEHYRALAFAQLTGCESLRDIKACLTARSAKLYHSGFHAPVRRSTLADANERHNWRIYADFSQRLIVQARALYADELLATELHETAYALDSTTIDLCLSMFPWATFRTTKATVKMHTLLDLRGSIPSFIHISEGNRFRYSVLVPLQFFEIQLDRFCHQFPYLIFGFSSHTDARKFRYIRSIRSGAVLLYNDEIFSLSHLRAPGVSSAPRRSSVVSRRACSVPRPWLPIGRLRYLEDDLGRSHPGRPPRGSIDYYS